MAPPPPHPSLGTAHPVALIAVIYQCLTFLPSSMEHFQPQKASAEIPSFSAIISHSFLKSCSFLNAFYTEFENIYRVPSYVFVRGQL
jgi:hypothetical protein